MPKIIKDCIYRFIEIPFLCQKFMDHPLFQRLRRIRQLGLAHYIFPSAVHTRFEHSLGVMHLSAVVVEQLRKFTPISNRDKDLVQLAGMLHDVGHVAFSHLFDSLMEVCPSEQKETHEQRSVRFLGMMNDELKLLTRDEEEIVKNMILGRRTSSKAPYLFEIVCNSQNGLDVDKMDYLQRDAYHTGLPGFQPDYLIRSMRISESDGHIVLQKKAENDVKDLYLTRKRMFTNVYYHKTLCKLERIYICMLSQRVTKKILSSRKELDDFRLETFLRDEFPFIMNEIDSRIFTHNCERCSKWIFEKTPSLNGHITGDGKIKYI